MTETTEYILRLGETVTLRPSFFKAGIKVVYAGALNRDTFSIAVQWSRGNNSLSYNLYFTDRQLEIFLPSGKIKVINISADKMLFKYHP